MISSTAGGIRCWSCGPSHRFATERVARSASTPSSTTPARAAWPWPWAPPKLGTRPPRLATAPLSQMQQRVWYLENVTPDGISHHIPSARRLEGELNVQALDQAWQQLLQRQAALRTVIERTPTGDRQRVLPHLQVSLLPLDDLSHLPESEREATLRQRMGELSLRPLNLEQGPLFAIRLFKLPGRAHILFFLVHPLIWDGWPFQIGWCTRKNRMWSR